ncbi:MAG: hypothetical protein GQ527_09380, partial [Bacteroidales bacterium]|nr:hypothetical protein [Bacteroidales bacterium]
MKKKLLFFILSFSSLIILAQNQHQDVVFPLRGPIIYQCQIIEVQAGNRVAFILNGKDSTIRAKAMIKNGEFIDFKAFVRKPHKEKFINSYDSLKTLTYKGKDYLYYNNLYLKAQHPKRTGMVLTFAGITAVGLTFVFSRALDNSYDGYIGIFGAVVIMGGTIVTSVGIPIWIHASALSYNNKAAM